MIIIAPIHRRSNKASVARITSHTVTDIKYHIYSKPEDRIPPFIDYPIDGRSQFFRNVCNYIQIRLEASSTSSTTVMVKFSLFTPCRHVEGAEEQLLSTLISALNGDEWLPSRPGRFTHSKESRYPMYRRLVGFRAGLGVLENRKISCSYGDSNPGPSDRSLVDVMCTPPRLP